VATVAFLQLRVRGLPAEVAARLACGLTDFAGCCGIVHASSCRSQHDSKDCLQHATSEMTMVQ